MLGLLAHSWTEVPDHPLNQPRKAEPFCCGAQSSSVGSTSRPSAALQHFGFLFHTFTRTPASHSIFLETAQDIFGGLSFPLFQILEEEMRMSISVEYF